MRESKVSSTFTKVAERETASRDLDLELRRRSKQRREVRVYSHNTVWDGVRLRRRRLAAGKSDAAGKSNLARSTAGRPAAPSLPSNPEKNTFSIPVRCQRAQTHVLGGCGRFAKQSFLPLRSKGASVLFDAGKIRGRPFIFPLLKNVSVYETENTRKTSENR